ncbi:MAG: flagellar type III secretion system pore protein FliP [Planctomycetota bacterium]
MRHLLSLLLAVLGLIAGARAQAPDPAPDPAPPASTPAAGAQGPGTQGAGTAAPFAAPGPGLTLTLNGGDERKNLGTAIEIVLLMTLLSMAPALVMTMTCFTRIVVVLSFLKRAMSMQDLPPALVTTGFALFMTVFVMKPVATDIYEQAYVPYMEQKMDFREAGEVAAARMNQFLLRQTREEDVALMLQLSGTRRPATAADTPLHIAVPAFVLSEIKTSFQMGFVLFLPFVVIDLVISSILVSMGMFTLPPVVVSTPLKLLLFVLVGGWDLVVVSLVQSFTA